MKFYPPGLVTRYGAELLKERTEPLILYVSGDRSVQWCIHGGLAPMPGVQEGAYLVDGIKGMHPPFDPVESKGARQDGVTTQRIVYDPMEMDMLVEFTVPPDPENPRLAASAMKRVIRDWLASWDPRNPGELIWVTPDEGVWRCNPRLFRSPPERQFRAQSRRLRQRYTWTIRVDDAFWRGTDSVSEFRFGYTKARDLFNRNDSGTLGANWKQTYTGPGAGVCETNNGRAGWTPSGNQERTVVNRLLGANEIQTININGDFSGGTWTYTVNGQATTGIAPDASAATVQSAIEALPGVGAGNVSVTGADGMYQVEFINDLAHQNISSSADGSNLTPDGSENAVTVGVAVDGSGPDTESDNQVITLKFGEAHEFPFPATAFIDIWGRLDDDDDNPTGVRARIGRSSITLSRFNNGVETVMATRHLNTLWAWTPLWWEDWTLVCGTPTDPRHFKVMRDKFTALSFKETGTGSALGPSNRGVAWGMKVGSGTSEQAVPPTIDEFSMGDNQTVTQQGALLLTNFGTEEAYPRYLCYGPGTFRIANGPGSTDFVEFGPLGDGQIALLTTKPRLRGVVDLSPDQPEQDLNFFQEFVHKLIGFAVNNNVPPLLEWFESLLGIQPPQGELYSLLNGRFTESIPPKPAGEPPTTVAIPCEIVNGNADSKIVAALTPLRRWPE